MDTVRTRHGKGGGQSQYRIHQQRRAKTSVMRPGYPVNTSSSVENPQIRQSERARRYAAAKGPVARYPARWANRA